MNENEMTMTSTNMIKFVGDSIAAVKYINRDNAVVIASPATATIEGVDTTGEILDGGDAEPNDKTVDGGDAPT
jgi:hypothetical protein